MYFSALQRVWLAVYLFNKTKQKHLDHSHRWSVTRKTLFILINRSNSIHKHCITFSIFKTLFRKGKKRKEKIYMYIKQLHNSKKVLLKANCNRRLLIFITFLEKTKVFHSHSQIFPWRGQVSVENISISSYEHRQ